MEDKRVALLYGILVCAILALGIGVLSLTLGNNEKEDKNTKTTLKVSTKTRRTTTSTESTSTNSTESTMSSSTSSSTSISSSTSSIKTTISSSTKKITTTKKVTTKATTKKTTSPTKKTTSQVVIPPNVDRETTTDSTTYPLAQDDIEWAIFDKINEARMKAGFNPVEVAVDFRRLAEEGADYLYDFGDNEVRKYLYGLNNYRRISNNLSSVQKAVLSLYTASIKNTPVITDESIRYVGIGVIFREIGLGDRPTYYYVIIYE